MNLTDRCLKIAMIWLTLLAVPAGATITYYNTQTAWEAATSNIFTIDFNDVVIPQNSSYVDYSTTGLQLHDVIFTENLASDYLWVIKSGTWEDTYPYAFGSGNYLRGSTWGTRYFQAALPSGVTALAMQLMTVAYGDTVTLSFSTGDSQEISTPAVAVPVFAGFVFSEPVEWVKIESTGNYAALDNFAYNQGLGEIPEASTAWLGGVGLLSLLLARRLRKRA
ncbi:MAG: hypothetical protein IT159_01770 [Bryobacterales bacterium]|nr:hypothetical protein [Bryobacterales bacterium]